MTTQARTRARPAQRKRRRRSPGWVPNQHGAWAMLATPLLVGSLASGLRWPHLLLAAFWFSGYFAFFATGLWLKSRRKPRYLPPMKVYLPLATVLGIALLLIQWRLLLWAPLFVLPMTVGLVASATRHERALLSGLATTVGSSLMTLVAYDLGPGTDWTRAWTLTAVLAVYFAGTVFYIKSAIRERGNTRFLAVSVAYHAVAALTAFVLLPGAAGLTLGVLGLVLTTRAALIPRLGWSAARLGVGEIVATVALALALLLCL